MEGRADQRPPAELGIQSFPVSGIQGCPAG